MPRLSPDGQRLALRIDEPTGSDIWIYELTRDRLTRLTSEGNNPDQPAGSIPVWSPNGTRIVFQSSRSGSLNMFVRASDGSGPADRLRASDQTEFAGSWSPDGSQLAFISGRPKEIRLALLKELNERIVAGAGISPDDLMIQLSEFPGENFSFGQGLAQRAFISQAT